MNVHKYTYTSQHTSLPLSAGMAKAQQSIGSNEECKMKQKL